MTRSTQTTPPQAEFKKLRALADKCLALQEKWGDRYLGTMDHPLDVAMIVEQAVGWLSRPAEWNIHESEWKPGPKWDTGWEKATPEQVLGAIVAGLDPNYKVMFEVDFDKEEVLLTVPMRAASDANPEALKALLLAGGDPSAGSWIGDTPMHWAASHDKPDNIRVLAEFGANPNATTKDGETPLHWANKSDVSIDCLRALAEAGADPEIADNKGNLPEFATRLELAA